MGRALGRLWRHAGKASTVVRRARPIEVAWYSTTAVVRCSDEEVVRQLLIDGLVQEDLYCNGAEGSPRVGIKSGLLGECSHVGCEGGCSNGSQEGWWSATTNVGHVMLPLWGL